MATQIWTEGAFSILSGSVTDILGTLNSLRVRGAENLSGLVNNSNTVMALVHTGGRKGLDGYLSAYWTLDGKDGTTVYDASGNSRTAYLSGAASKWNFTSGVVTTSVNGLLSGACIEFFGAANQNIVYPVADFPSGAFTISCWALVTSGTAITSTRLPLFGCDLGSLSPSFYLSMNNVPQSSLLYFGTNNYRYFNWSSFNPSDNLWHHYAIVVEGFANSAILASKFFVDGIEQTVSSTDGTGPQTEKELFMIGRANNYQFTGLIDDFRVYNTILSGADVRAIYNASK